MFTSIAVPLDGSAFGDFAIPYAASLARRSGAPLELLHVHRPFLPGAALEALTQYRFQDVVEAADAADEAARGEYDLIAMATHGRGGLRPLLLGSTADKVLRGGRTPIFVFRPREVASTSTVLEGVAMSAVD